MNFCLTILIVNMSKPAGNVGCVYICGRNLCWETLRQCLEILQEFVFEKLSKCPSIFLICYGIASNFWSYYVRPLTNSYSDGRVNCRDFTNTLGLTTCQIL